MRNSISRKIPIAVVVGLLILINIIQCTSPQPEANPRSADTIPGQKDNLHEATGLKIGVGLDVVIANCTGCHSAKLVTQNRATRDGWQRTIHWMQETQNLWPLGENEDIILDYLAKYYAPDRKGRRENLKGITWYELKN